MPEPTTPVSSTSAACCGTAAAEARAGASEVSAPAAPCCGTAKEAAAAGTCCDPAAKGDAVAAGAGCC